MFDNAISIKLIDSVDVGGLLILQLRRQHKLSCSTEYFLQQRFTKYRFTGTSLEKSLRYDFKDQNNQNLPFMPSALCLSKFHSGSCDESAYFQNAQRGTGHQTKTARPLQKAVVTL